MKLFFMTLTLLNFAYSSELEVLIKNVKNNQGSIRVAIWNQADGFPRNHATSYDQAIVPARNNVIVQFSDLSDGEYAVAAYHDANDDEVLNTNFLGVPRESFGFSNNPSILRGPPSFNRAKFIVNQDIKKVHQVITLKSF